MEHRPKTIAIASVLKPVSDTRMTSKLAATLATLPNTHVHVFGYPASASATHLSIHPSRTFSRISIGRIVQGLRLLKQWLRLRPDLLIVCTHELLWEAMAMKLFTKCKVVYDVQENYWRNILYTKAFPIWLRPVLALYVRAKERLSLWLVNHYLLAEAGYVSEMNFFADRFTIIENKAHKPAEPAVVRDKNKLIFSGTLAETTGVYTAINLVRKLHEIDPGVYLLIIGLAALKEDQVRLKRLATKYPFIRLQGIDALVHHNEIIQQIRTAGAGIISYPPNPATEGSVPTKLYEYLAHRLPIFLTNHPSWIRKCMPFNAAIVFRPDAVDAKALMQAYRGANFYDRSPSDVFWEDEAHRLSKVITSLL
jgi:glycosyltransferase involved in cell wall biosynthesis